MRAIKPPRGWPDFNRPYGKLVANIMRRYDANVIKRLKHYPSQLPTKSGYRRTGNLGRRWVGRVIVRGDGIVATENNSTGYWVWVQGPTDESPGQTDEMARRNWESITAIQEEEWDDARAEIRELLLTIGREGAI